MYRVTFITLDTFIWISDTKIFWNSRKKSKHSYNRHKLLIFILSHPCLNKSVLSQLAFIIYTSSLIVSKSLTLIWSFRYTLPNLPTWYPFLITWIKHPKNHHGNPINPNPFLTSCPMHSNSYNRYPSLLSYRQPSCCYLHHWNCYKQHTHQYLWKHDIGWERKGCTRSPSCRSRSISFNPIQIYQQTEKRKGPARVCGMLVRVREPRYGTHVTRLLSRVSSWLYRCMARF